MVGVHASHRLRIPSLSHCIPIGENICWPQLILGLVALHHLGTLSCIIRSVTAHHFRSVIQVITRSLMEVLVSILIVLGRVKVVRDD